MGNKKHMSVTCCNSFGHLKIGVLKQKVVFPKYLDTSKCKYQGIKAEMLNRRQTARTRSVELRIESRPASLRLKTFNLTAYHRYTFYGRVEDLHT